MGFLPSGHHDKFYLADFVGQDFPDQRSWSHPGRRTAAKGFTERRSPGLRNRRSLVRIQSGAFGPVPCRKGACGFPTSAEVAWLSAEAVDSAPGVISVKVATTPRRSGRIHHS